MTTTTVTNASQLSSALQAAKGGDIIRLVGGDYGDFTISAKSFASDITITSADTGNPASFNTLNVMSSANINFQGVNVDFSPTTTTASFSTAVMVDKSSGISFANGIIKGGPAISGVSPDSTGTDASDNVIGMPTGRGMTIQGSSDVTVQGMDISSFMRGIAIGSSKQVTIKDNEIHDLRKTAIVGNADDLVIEGNYLHSAHPWRIGEVGGDHADFIALWTDPRQTAATANVTIKDNVLSQGDGARILGLWLQGDKAGYVNVVIEGNAILGGDNQGIMMSNTTGGRVTDNVLVQTTSYDKSPGILLLEGAKNIEVTENIAWAIADKNLGTTGNVIDDNTLVQKASALKAGYYDITLINKIVGLEDAQAIYKLVADDVGAPLGDDGPVTAPPVVTPPPVVLPPPVDGGADGHTIIGSSAANTLKGTAGDDIIDGQGGKDTLTGGAGNDTYIVPNTLAKIVEKAGEGIDTVIARGNHVLGANLENLEISTAVKNSWSGTGNGLDNVIKGNDGNNRLDGAAGADTLTGGAGNDTITGGTGNDNLFGGVGGDRLIGGAGNDVFRFSPYGGKDVVADFGAGTDHDVIDISAFINAGFKPIIKDIGADTTISFSTGDVITLTGVNPHDLIATKVGYTS